MSTDEPRRHHRFTARFTAETSAAGQLTTCQGEDIGAGGCKAVVPFIHGMLGPVRLTTGRS